MAKKNKKPVTKKTKVVKNKKAAKAPKAPKIKMYGIPVRTAASKAVRKLGWKLKESRPKEHCIKQGCSKTGCQKIWCKKHNKILRKMQLKLNNIPWRKKVKAGGGLSKYKRTQVHVAYNNGATKFAVANPDVARKRVKNKHSVVFKTTKMLEKALDDARAQMRKLGKKTKVVKSKPAPAAKGLRKGEKVVKVNKKNVAKFKKKMLKIEKKLAKKQKVSADELDFT